MKVMQKEFGYVVVSLGGAPNQYSISASQTNWEQPTPPQGLVVSKSYFDLAGLTMSEKTLFFQTALVQQLGLPTITSGAAGDFCNVYDVMTSSPMTDAELQLFPGNANFSGLGSAATTGLTFDQTIFARARTYSLTVDLAASGYMPKISDHQLGSLSPTASDRIYCYRIVFITAAGTNKDITIPPARYILSADAKEEPEFEYLMRLKRSYELQQSYDED